MNTEETILERAVAAHENENYEEALSLARDIADHDAMAQFIVGGAYLHGLGVEKNEEKAIAWYKRSAEGGFLNSQLLMGRFYWDGELVPASRWQALRWYRRAAAQGHDLAKLVVMSFELQMQVDRTQFRKIIATEIADFLETREQLMARYDGKSSLSELENLSSSKYGFDTRLPQLIGDKQFYVLLHEGGKAEPVPFGFKLLEDDTRRNERLLCMFSALTESGIIRFVPASENLGGFSESAYALEHLANSDIWDILYDTLNDCTNVMSPSIVKGLLSTLGWILTDPAVTEDSEAFQDYRCMTAEVVMEDFLEEIFACPKTLEPWVTLTMQMLDEQELDSDLEDEYEQDENSEE